MIFPQDLHIHTTYSPGDSAVAMEQTIELIEEVRHAWVIGISDHFEFLVDGLFAEYEAKVRKAGFKLGVEVDGSDWVNEAITYDNLDYFVYHCQDRDSEYRGAEKLLQTDKPVIIAHPNALATDLDRLPPDCLVEINNRYVWRTDWYSYYKPYTDEFRFVIGSDAHQPNWLGQAVARSAAARLGIEEYLLFSE